MKETIAIASFPVTLFESGGENLLIQMSDEHEAEGLENEVRLIQERSNHPFTLAAIPVRNWNDDLSPWEADPVFGKEGFGGKGKEMLEILVNKILPVLKEKTDARRVTLGGYSLAGLFALYGGYECDSFDSIAAASPSVWFDRFTEHYQSQTIHAQAVYLSLGDKEKKSRNARMAKVEDCIQIMHDALTNQCDCILEMNEGNHFKDADLRTAKGFAWILNKIKEKENGI